MLFSETFPKKTCALLRRLEMYSVSCDVWRCTLSQDKMNARYAFFSRSIEVCMFHQTFRKTCNASRRLRMCTVLCEDTPRDHIAYQRPSTVFKPDFRQLSDFSTGSYIAQGSHAKAIRCSVQGRMLDWAQIKLQVSVTSFSFWHGLPKLTRASCRDPRGDRFRSNCFATEISHTHACVCARAHTHKTFMRASTL